MINDDRLDGLIAERLRTDAPQAAPPALLASTLNRIGESPRIPSRRPIAGLLAAAAVVALAILVGLQLPTLLGPPVGSDPSPTPTPAAPTPVAKDWGPLAVVTVSGDQARTEGTLRITTECVFLEMGEGQGLVVWPAGPTRWNAGDRTIAFTNDSGGTVTLASGDVVAFGGGWSPTESGQDVQEWIDSVAWVQPPDEACLSDISSAWFVTSVLPPPEPTAPPTPSPSPLPITAPPSAGSGEWELAATFGTGSDREPTFVFDATAWRGGFAAIGLRLDYFASDVGPYPGEPLIWTSPDGRTWSEHALGIPLETQQPGVPSDDRIEHLLGLSDGRLLAIRAAYGPTQAWISDDAIRWEPLDLGIGDVSPYAIAQGPRGYVMVAAGVDRNGVALYSDDGLTWTTTHESPAAGVVDLFGVAGGPDGFVIVGRDQDVGEAFILASADGRSWLRADPDQDAFSGGVDPLDVAPLGGDWIATGFATASPEARPVLWRSTNGLDWVREAGPADPDGRDTSATVNVSGNAGHVVLATNESGIWGPFPMPAYAWSTTDGSRWATILPNRSHVVELASVGTTVIAAGTIGRGDSAAFWVIADR